LTSGTVGMTRVARMLAPSLASLTLIAPRRAWGRGNTRFRGGLGCRRNGRLAGQDSLYARPEAAVRGRSRRGRRGRRGCSRQGRRGRGGREKRRDRRGFRWRLAVLRAGLHHLGRGRHEVGGLALLGKLQLIVAYALDRVFRGLDVLVRYDDELRLALVLERAE